MSGASRPMRDRAVSVVDTMDEPDDDDLDSVEEGLATGHPRFARPANGRAGPMQTPFFTRLRQRMTWGTTSKDEKRALWQHQSGDGPLPGRSRRKRPQRQSDLSVPTELLLQALRKRLASAGDAATDDDVSELSALLRVHLRHELMESALWLVDAFDVLSSDSSSAAPAASASGFGDVDAPSQTATSEVSDRFVDGLCALMARANFRLFSQREWEFAQSESFMFTLPVDVAWESLDSSAISRLFVRHPHLGLQAAQLARRVLVFHRGSGVAQMTSYFFEEKIDMLIDRLFTDPFRRVVATFGRLACPKAAARAAEAEAESRAERDAGAWELADEQTQRVNLTRTLPTTCTLLARFFRKLTVQEPTLQEVVVVYTEIAGASQEDNGYDSAGGGAIPGSLHVRLKSFRDIPTADVEVVLPGLRASGMKSADVVKIVLYLLGGVVAAIYGFVFGTHSRWLLTATLLGLLALRAYQTWASVVHARHVMNEFIRTTLYHRSQDSQRGVLLTVLNSIGQHELREALAIYLLMRSHGLRKSGKGANGAAAATMATGAGAGSQSGGGGSVTVAEVEQLAADFLEGEFGTLVHVRADEALERLRLLGLVQRDGVTPMRDGAEGAAARASCLALPGLQPDYVAYSAVPIADALAILRRLWGEHARVAAAASQVRQPQPSLMQLTAPTTPGGGRRRLEEQSSPITPYPARDLYPVRDLSM